jgi:hypothetical protein
MVTPFPKLPARRKEMSAGALNQHFGAMQQDFG